MCAEYNSVYRYALSLCKNENEAEDLAQETFFKAMKASDSFSGESSLYTWLCSISKNLWLNKIKKQKKEIPPDDIEYVFSDEIQLEHLLDEKDISLHIHKILHTLKEPYKEVFSLRVFGELSFSDISDLFKKSESWSRVTYHRAKKMIVKKMEKDGLL